MGGGASRLLCTAFGEISTNGGRGGGSSWAGGAGGEGVVERWPRANVDSAIIQ